MSKFTLSSDSSCDLYYGVQKEFGIDIIPLTFTREKGSKVINMEDNFKSMAEYVDFYNQVDQQYLFRTSQINTFTHLEYFKSLIARDNNDVLHFSLSSGLSGTAEAALQAAEQINQTSDKKVYVVDSISATGGGGSLVLMAKDMRDNGENAKTVAAFMNNVKYNLHHWFFVTDLFHLKRGGRVSSIQAVLGSALKVRPMLTIDNVGKLQVVEKNKGDKKSMAALIDKVKNFGENLENQHIQIIHTNRENLAQELKADLQKFIKRDIPIIMVGPVIGTHLGSGALGVIFFGKKRWSDK